MKIPRRRLLRTACHAAALAAALPGTLVAPAANASGSREKAKRAAHFAASPELDRFVRAMIDRHGFDDAWLRRTFAGVRRTPQVLRLIAPPTTGFKRSWDTYRARFVEPVRIREGLRFWRTHERALERAQHEYGVPAEVIVSIIGVETIYGRYTGEFRVIDALATLAFEDPRRAAYFRSELEQYLLLVRDTGVDPYSVRGSYAGAIGLPQFMPGSIRNYAVDFDRDGVIDLRTSPVDAIGSVARFLSMHGWVPGEPTHLGARVDDEANAVKLLEAGIEPLFTIAELAAHGVTPRAEASHGDARREEAKSENGEKARREEPQQPQRFALVDLASDGGPTVYLLGARNFYVITRYNRSSFYAMAVIDLARTLRLAR